MNKFYCSLFFHLLFITNSLAQKFEWAKQAGGTGPDNGYGIARDATGNLYVTGWFEGVFTIGNITLTSRGVDDILIAKFDASGNLLWAKQAGSVSQDGGNAIAVDAQGNCYVT